MTRISLIVGFTVALLPFAPRALAESISIDEFSGKETLIAFDPPMFGTEEEFAYGGVTVSARDRFLLSGNADMSGYFDNIPDASLGVAMKTSGAASFPTRLRFDFDSPMRRFGLLTVTNIASSWTITAFDDEFNELASSTGVMPGNSLAVFAGLESAQSFTRVELVEDQRNGQDDAFDDIRFEAVPEPTSLGILATFIAFAFFFAKRAGSYRATRRSSDYSSGCMANFHLN